jgi:FtsH-binding integral membrane protein
MNQNPYAFAAELPAAEAAASERATFLRKVYSLILAGVLVFAGSLWAAGSVPAVNSLSGSMWQLIAGGRFGWLIYMAIMMGGFWLVHAVSRTFPINLIAYFAWSFLLAMLAAPLVLYAAHAAPATLNTASAVTAATFTGLTAFVLLTGKDFSFLRGILFLAFWGILVLSLCGMLFGFGSSLLFSGLGTLFFAGYILYDTSEVLHRFPTTRPVSAAVELFTDVVMLFQNVLILLLSLRNSD